ncbi:MAG: zinc-binding dehydrogenase [Lentisphaeria bacterium]|nr:zinc-binding dehydrogenase [Lentisphaeria bacterium]
MKAAIIEEVGKLSIKDIQGPVPGDYDVLCETQYGALCTGTDTHLLHYHPPFCNWIKLPAILGHESIGKVIQLGSKVRHFKVGDMITRVGHPGVDGIDSAWGGFSEYTLGKDWQAMKDDGLDEKEWSSHTVNQVLPEGISPAAGTMFITWRETLSYMTRIGPSTESSVMIIGSGSNGLAMANHAANFAAKKIVLLGSSNRINESKRVGSTAFIDYKAKDAHEQALALSPSGYDIVIDVIGRPATTDLALSCVADGGTLGIYGMDDSVSIKIKPELARGAYTIYGGGYDEGEAHQDVCDLVKAGKLAASIWIDENNAFSLDDIHKAFDASEARSQVKPLIKISTVND